MKNFSPAIQQVVDAIQGKPDAIKELAAALVTKDVARIRDAVDRSTGIQLSEADLGTFLASMPSDPQQVVAYCT